MEDRLDPASAAGSAPGEDLERSSSGVTGDNAPHSRASSVRRRADTDDSEKAGRRWAREVDDPWWPCILTLDGGGIRGYSSLLILKALMHEIWLWEQKLDAEENEERQGQRSDGPDGLAMNSREERQAAAGATRGRSPLHQELGNDAEEVEAQYSVAPQEPSHEDTVTLPAQRTLGKDKIAADVTVKKALAEDEMLPCHYFDFMYGTSTGGLIATMLGRLRMTVSEALELYRKVGDDLFGRRRSRIPLTTKYHHEPLEKAVQDIVGSRCHEHPNCDGKDDLHPWDADQMDRILRRQTPFDVDEPRVCQSCCLTATHDSQITEAYLLRSYPHFYSPDSPNWITRYNEGADELPIWKVTRATSAAPFYFEMVKHEVDGVKQSFKDGGIRENNPSGAALSEFHSLYEGKADRPALLLSVGTGLPNTNQDGFATTWPGIVGRVPMVAKFLEKLAVVQNLLIKYTEGEHQHHQTREYAHGEHTWYKRLNVSEGLQGMPLDSWTRGEWHGEPHKPGGATLTHMEEVTQKYLERDYEPAFDSYAPPSVMLMQAAEKLVRQRRAREMEGGVRWETFVGSFLRRNNEEAETDVR